MPTDQVVLVTGATGYLGSWIVNQLLEAGCSVHATVRSLNDRDKTRHLRALQDRFGPRLELFESDLLVEGSFDAPMRGCTSVVHSASPYFLSKPDDVEAELVKPAVDGTKNVLRAVERTGSVRRVLVTSSVAALYGDACELDASVDHRVSESGVNRSSNHRHNPYAYSKTVAERAAWDMAETQDRWQLITIHPGAIFGPSLSSRVDATSVDMMMQLLNGSYRSGVPRLWMGLVDVRDVADAHVAAVLHGEASGRYIVVAEELRVLELARLMEVEELGLAGQLPKREAPKALMWLVAPWVGLQRRYIGRNVNHPLRFDNTRGVRELGLSYRAPATTVNDHVRQLVDDGLIQPRRA